MIAKRDDREQMLPREEVMESVKDCAGQAGMLNVWTCHKCGHHTLGVHLDAGVTPMLMSCPGCGAQARSQWYRMRQPELLWIRPRDLKDLSDYTREAFVALPEWVKKTRAFSKFLADNIQHYNNGGLFPLKVDRDKNK